MRTVVNVMAEQCGVCRSNRQIFYERLNRMTLQEFLERQFDEELMLAVLSGQRSREKDAPSKVRIRQIELKGSVCYQASAAVGTKVLHSNYSRAEVVR